MKVCKKCGGTEFYKTRHCKFCSKEANRIWKQNNIEKVRESRIKWLEKNKEKQIQCTKSWSDKNKDRVRKNAFEWRLRNKERARYLYKRWAFKNKDRRTELAREWRKINKDKCRIYVQNRLERKRNGIGKLSNSLAKKLYELQKGKCACCSKPLGGDFHMDHIVPLFLGGEHSDSNIQLLRSTCNLKKGAKHPIDYMQNLGFLI